MVKNSSIIIKQPTCKSIAPWLCSSGLLYLASCAQIGLGHGTHPPSISNSDKAACQLHKGDDPSSAFQPHLDLIDLMIQSVKKEGEGEYTQDKFQLHLSLKSKRLAGSNLVVQNH